MRFETGWEYVPCVGKREVFRINGQRVTKAEYEAAIPKKLGLAGRGHVKEGIAGNLTGQLPAGWPMEADMSLAVHPTQVSEMAERCKKEGVPTRFNPETGAPIWENKAHRKAYLRMEKCHDRNSFLGD